MWLLLFARGYIQFTFECVNKGMMPLSVKQLSFTASYSNISWSIEYFPFVTIIITVCDVKHKSNSLHYEGNCFKQDSNIIFITVQVNGKKINKEQIFALAFHFQWINIKIM
jgi:hypothetical protein